MHDKPKQQLQRRQVISGTIVNNIAINNLTTNNALFMVALFTTDEGLSLKCLVPPWNQTFNIFSTILLGYQGKW